MTDTQKIAAAVILVGGGLYVFMRQREQDLANSNTMLPPGYTPQAPSLLGMNVGSGTNPFTQLISGITGVFSRLGAKQAGNAPGSPSTPSTTAVPTLSWTLPKDANFIPPPPLNPNGGIVASPYPQLGDPQLGQWFDAAYAQSGWDAIQPDAGGFYSGGLPDLGWTLDSTTLGFDPNYIPPPPTAGGISILGLT